MRAIRVAVVVAAAAASVTLFAAVAAAGLSQTTDPKPERIFAVHPPRGEGFITEYEVTGNLGAGSWEFVWTKVGSDCGTFSQLGRTVAWVHEHPPCPEQHPHPARIHVWFGDGSLFRGWECVGLYEFGSAAGFGREAPKCAFVTISSRPQTEQEIAAERERKQFYTTMAAAYGAASAAFGLAAIAVPPAAPALAGACAAAAAIAAIYGLLALDPPDANFRVIAQPRIRSTPTVRPGRGVTRALATSINRLNAQSLRGEAFARAHLTSFERAQGAAVAGDRLWNRRQKDAAAGYARSAADALNALPALRAALARAIRASGRPTSVSAQQLRNAQRQIIRRGFTASLRTQLRRAGLTPAQINSLQTQARRLRIRGGLTSFAASASLTSADRATAQALRGYAASIHP